MVVFFGKNNEIIFLRSHKRKRSMVMLLFVFYLFTEISLNQDTYAGSYFLNDV